jgi:hypothetical protein
VEPDRFDVWTRKLATRTSRRRSIRGLAGGAIAALGLHRLEVAAQPARVTICHWESSQGASSN